ncbi:MAG: LuxR C-terminal-related transcriptional regulator [Bacteroidota bacterium]
MEQPILLLAHRYEVYLNGLIYGLESENYEIGKVVRSGIDALHYVIEKRPTLAILDTELPVLSAFDIIKTATEKGVKTKFVLIFPDAQQEYLVVSRSLNAAGTVLVSDSFDAISRCIDNVIKGITCFSSGFSNNSMMSIDTTLSYIDLLSETERQILFFIGKEKNSVQMAEMLGTSKRTVEKHRSNIIAKLKLDKKTNSLVHWVYKNRKLVSTLHDGATY